MGQYNLVGEEGTMWSGARKLIDCAMYYYYI